MVYSVTFYCMSTVEYNRFLPSLHLSLSTLCTNVSDIAYYIAYCDKSVACLGFHPITFCTYAQWVLTVFLSYTPILCPHPLTVTCVYSFYHTFKENLSTMYGCFNPSFLPLLPSLVFICYMCNKCVSYMRSTSCHTSCPCLLLMQSSCVSISPPCLPSFPFLFTCVSLGLMRQPKVKTVSFSTSMNSASHRGYFHSAFCLLMLISLL